MRRNSKPLSATIFTIGGNGNDGALAVCELSDGSIIAAGQTSSGLTSDDGWVLRLRDR